jgi:DNA-binding NarL/FixJ family response regulator
MAETVGAIRTSMPDAVVLDLFDTDADERMAAATLRQVDDRVRLIVLHCGSEPPRDRTGRMIYLTNQDGLARLLDAIRQGHAQDGARSDDWKHTPALSPSERRVAVLVAEGYPNRRIAQELHLSERTVRNYVSNILDKLVLNNRTELATAVVRTDGLILE